MLTGWALMVFGSFGQDNCKAQKQALCEKFDRMYAILEERRKIMLQRITYEQEEKTQHVKSLARLYGDRVESASKLVDTALQSMEEPQMAVFVQVPSPPCFSSSQAELMGFASQGQEMNKTRPALIYNSCAGPLGV